MEIEDIVRKIIGPIKPVGESHIDEKRYENLKLHIALVDELVRDIEDVTEYAERIEHSMRKAGKEACKYLAILKKESKEWKG